jgi:hypothetical protein
MPNFNSVTDFATQAVNALQELSPQDPDFSEIISILKRGETQFGINAQISSANVSCRNGFVKRPALHNALKVSEIFKKISIEGLPS